VVVCISGAEASDDARGARLEGVVELARRVDDEPSEGPWPRPAVYERLCERGVACGRCVGRHRLVVFLDL